jgi:predicted membrane protein DUF2232
MTTRGASWRPVLGLLAFVVWAPPSLVGLPFAALVFATGPRGARERWAAALVAALSIALLVLPAHGLLAAATRAHVVLVTATFVLLTLYWPGRFLPQALRATAIGGVATAGLAWVTWGVGFWGALQWEATREASHWTRLVLAGRPETFPAFEAAVRFASETVPATLVLQTLAGLALAWQWHARVATRPLGEPLGAFRELRFSDHWVWGVVAALAIWTVPWLAALKTAALNLAVVAAALYLLRGAAIVVAFAQVTGISTGALLLSGALAAVLAVPMLFLVPGLWTLGVSDTWLEFRRRFTARPHVP